MKTRTRRSPWVGPPVVNAELVVAVHFHTVYEVHNWKQVANKGKRDAKALKVLPNQTL